MAAFPVASRETGRLSVRSDERRPCDEQAANYGQHRFHVSIIVGCETVCSSDLGMYLTAFVFRAGGVIRLPIRLLLF
jgi:hypothetical protein